MMNRLCFLPFSVKLSSHTWTRALQFDSTQPLTWHLFGKTKTPHGLSLSLSLSLSLCVCVCVWCLSTLDRRRVVAPSMLTDPSQHSKHQKERVLCSWWPASPSIFADDLVVSSRCQTVLSPVVTWLRDVGLGRYEQPDPYAWRGQRECLLRLIASFLHGSCKRVATSTFVTNSYQKMLSIRLWFVIEKPPVSLYISFQQSPRAETQCLCGWKFHTHWLLILVWRHFK